MPLVKAPPPGRQPVYNIRISRNLTQPEMGKIIGEKQWTVSRIESGFIVPSQAQLSRMCKTLKVKPEDLFSVHVLAEVRRRATVKA